MINAQIKHIQQNVPEKDDKKSVKLGKIDRTGKQVKPNHNSLNSFSNMTNLKEGAFNGNKIQVYYTVVEIQV